VGKSRDTMRKARGKGAGALTAAMLMMHWLPRMGGIPAAAASFFA
jgi:hypothetical protein